MNNNVSTIGDNKVAYVAVASLSEGTGTVTEVDWVTRLPTGPTQTHQLRFGSVNTDETSSIQSSLASTSPNSSEVRVKEIEPPTPRVRQIPPFDIAHNSNVPTYIMIDRNINLCNRCGSTNHLTISCTSPL